MCTKMKSLFYFKTICSIRTGVILAVWCLCLNLSATMHTWVTKNGDRFEAEYVREMFDKITVRLPDGTTRILPVEELSDADVQYARQAVPPEIEIDVSVSSENKPIPQIYKDATYLNSQDYTTIWKARVTVRQISQSPYAGKLPVEVYLLGQEVATPDYRTVGIARGQVEFTAENEGVYELVATAQTRRYWEYSDEWRGVKYAGYVVIVFDPQGNVLASKTDLRWLKDQSEKLAKLRTYPAGLYFYDENFRERAVPRPKYFLDRARF